MRERISNFDISLMAIKAGKLKDNEVAELVSEITKEVKAICPDAPQILREVISKAVKSGLGSRYISC